MCEPSMNEAMERRWRCWRRWVRWVRWRRWRLQREQMSEAKRRHKDKSAGGQNLKTLLSLGEHRGQRSEVVATQTFPGADVFVEFDWCYLIKSKKKRSAYHLSA